MRLKIVSDGELMGTRVLNADTGEDLELPLLAVRWSVTGLDSPAVAELTVLLVSVEVESKINEIQPAQLPRLMGVR